VTLKIQIDPDQAFLSVNSRVGAGGLPVGSSGRGLLLLSGGIDSPVAGWYAMRRGLRLRALHFHSPPYTGSAVTRKIEDLAGVLRLYDPGFGVLLARFTETQEIIRDRVREDYRMVMLRWAMVRIASRVAGSLGLSALVSGENLGQVASQTIDNMACIEKASTLPLVRPLIAFDKADTVRRAREIGSYAVSIRRAEDCCSLFVPRHPVTRADPGTCLGFDAMLEESGAYDRCMETITDL
jgi:thiamine biosynthesis protein ThiI